MKKILASITFVVTALLAVLANFSLAKAETNTDLTTEQINSIKKNCAIIKDNLKSIQYEDSRVRVHLGRYYDIIQSNFITPLNVALVGNNISNINLIENQTNFVTARSKFASDYIAYQKGLEELVSLDCTAEPTRFYNKLTGVREKRAKVNSDTAKLQDLTNKQIDLVTKLKESL